MGDTCTSAMVKSKDVTAFGRDILIQLLCLRVKKPQVARRLVEIWAEAEIKDWVSPWTTKKGK